MTSSAPCRAACRSAAMLTAYDSVLAPASSQGIASAPVAGSPRSSVTAANPSRRTAATRSGTRGDHHVRGRRRAAFPAAAVDQPQRALVGGPRSTAARPRRSRCRQPGRSGGQLHHLADWVSRCRCGSTRQAPPSRTSSVSKMPSPRTTARSSACSSGVLRLVDLTVERDDHGRLPSHGREVSRRRSVELTCEPPPSPRPNPDPTPVRSGITAIRSASSARPRPTPCWWTVHIARC